MEYHASNHGILWNTMVYHLTQWNTMQEHNGIPWNNMEATMEYHGIQWNTMEYHGIPWNPMEYHARSTEIDSRSTEIDSRGTEIYYIVLYIQLTVF